MYAQAPFRWFDARHLARLVSILFASAAAIPTMAQLVDIDAQARASREKLAADIAEVDHQRLRAKLINSTEDRELARWYAGEMQWNSRWMSLQSAQSEAATEEVWLDYRELRSKASDNLRDHERLARWCEKNDLVDLARMHWLHVLRFNQSHRVALNELNLVWYDSTLMTTDEASNYKQREREWKKQTRDWQANVKRLKKRIENGPPAEQQAARAQLLAIDQPEAVPALIEEFAVADKDEAKTIARGELLMDVLGEIESPAAVESLTEVAVLSTVPKIRYAALNQLKAKPFEQYVPALLAGMAMPIEASVNINSIGNRVVSSYSYSQEKPGGEQYTENSYSSRMVRGPRYLPVQLYTSGNYVPGKTIQGRSYRVPIIPGHGARNQQSVYRSPCGGQVRITTQRVYDPKFTKIVTDPDTYVPGGYKMNPAGVGYAEDPNYYAREQAVKRGLQSEAAHAEVRLEQRNQAIQTQNEQISDVLSEVTGEKLSAFPKSWWNWWSNYLETHPDVGTVGTRQQLNAALLNQNPRGLARGTWVWTRRGKQPIESIRPGDYVLSQDPRSGELAYQVVLAISTPQSMTVSRVEVDESDLHCAPGHVVWATGSGWRRVSKLEAGQSLHGATAESTIGNVNEAFEIDSYDLIVDGFHTFFVGESSLLVHDGTPIAATHVALPGFSPAAVATAIELAAK